MSNLILAINPGSTSTKVSLYNGLEEVASRNISHSAEELSKYFSVIDQFEFRLGKIKEFIVSNNIDTTTLAAIVGRGGFLRPIISGTYLVDEEMLQDLKSCRYGSHASNLGALLANSLAKEANCAAFIVDPIVVDELDPLARITGHPDLQKRSVFHALNQKAVAKRFAQSKKMLYEDMNLIVAHLGGGISVGCHRRGRVIEVNNAVDGAGPFSPERSGTLPAGQFANNIATRNLSDDQIAKMLAGRGGLVAHLGTNDAREVERRITAGDNQAKLVYDAMIYNVARYIAAAAVAVQGKVDYILLTGGLAYSKYLTEKLTDYVSFIAPVQILPGEDELRALAEGALRVISGQEKAKQYGSITSKKDLH
ncbi:Butyrate kinase 2 [Sporomusa carbonis]|uniref:butyrate kinase n=1 Tax=Sporomusa carbonis TaxID=3076075 RepID=UPI003A5F0780